MFTSTFNISCTAKSLVCQCNLTAFLPSLCASRGLKFATLLSSVQTRGELQRSSAGAFNDLSVLWRYVKHDVRDAWQECWGGKRTWRAALPHHHLLPCSQPSWAPPTSSPQIYGFCWMQAELFCILPINPRSSAIDHRFAQWFVTGWTIQVKTREDRVN